jgi:AraC family transcriptional activator of pobA
MLQFHTLLVDHASMQLPGLRVLGIALHRHLAQEVAIEPHRNRWGQVIFYLDGQGRLMLESGTAEVDPGTVVVLPPGKLHSFERTAERPPLCLVIDFRLHGEDAAQETVCHLGREDLMQIQRELAPLLRSEPETGVPLSLECATILLQILVGTLRAAGWMERPPTVGAAEPSPAIRHLVSTIDPTAPLVNLVQRSGYNRDYLNRLVKRDTGLTLGQLRNQQRLTKAKELLASGMQVGSTASMVGLPDQSYFARWFRRQTGHPPSRWINRAIGAAITKA